MKINSFFALLLCVLGLLASCRSTDDEVAISPASIVGKWEFVKIEEKFKTVLPVTTDITIKLEFAATEPEAPVLTFSGNNLVNTYSGTAVYAENGSDGGTLTTSIFNASEVVGETKQMEFDAIYLGHLANATSYSVAGKTLTVHAKGVGRTEGQTYKLIFVRPE